MENNNSQPVYQSPESQAPAAKKSPVEMIMSLLSGITKKANKKGPSELKPQPAPETSASEAPPPQPEVNASPAPTKKGLKIPKKLIFVAILVIVILAVLSIVMSLLGRNGGVNLTATPAPSATPSPTPVVEIPSRYADDEDVAEIKRQMEELDRDLNEANFRDETLRVPNLDWNVSFD